MPSPLVAQIAAATAGEFDVLAELGAGTSVGTGVLAREVGTGALVVLALPGGSDELVVLAALGEDVPADGGRCVTCGTRPAVWRAECPGCGQPLAGGPDDDLPVDDVRAAIEVDYDFLGPLAHQGGGVVYLAHERGDARLVALAPVAGAGGERLLQVVWEQLPARAAAAPTEAPPAGATWEAPVSTAPAGLAPVAEPPAAGAEGDGRRRGPWLAVGAAALVLAVGAWALLGRDADGNAAVPPRVAAGDVAPSELPAPTPAPRPDAALPVPADPTPAPAPTPTADAARADSADRAARTLAAPHLITIEGELPSGWSRTVNGRARSSNRTVRLTRPGAALLRLEAPGYCPESVRITPTAGAFDRWAPRLRGAPMVGEC